MSKVSYSELSTIEREELIGFSVIPSSENLQARTDLANELVDARIYGTNDEVALRVIPTLKSLIDIYVLVESLVDFDNATEFYPEWVQTEEDESYMENEDCVQFIDSALLDLAFSIDGQFQTDHDSIVRIHKGESAKSIIESYSK